MEDLSPLWISLKTACVATIFAFFLGITVAGWMFGYQGKGKGIIDAILTLPLVLPPTVVGFLLLLLLGRNSPVGQILGSLGISIIFSWSATAIAASVVAFPLMYKTVLGAFKQVDRDLINCARTLGASETRIFWQVLLPLAWPGVMAGTVLAFARALGEFGATLMLAGSIPGRTQTIPISIFFAAEAGKMEEALIWVLIMVAIALIAITTINYWSDSQNHSQTQLVNYCSILINRWWTIISHRLLSWRKTKTCFFKSANIKNISPPIIKDFTTFPSTYQSEGCPIGRGEVTFKSEQRKKLTTKNKGLLVDLEKNLTSSFTLKAKFTANGKPLGILGASGSGKSLTLRCIAGLQTPTQGRIVLNGRVLFDSKDGINIPPHQRHIGFVFQNYALFPHMKVAQNISFGLHDLPKAQRKEQVWKYIELMQLQGLENRYPHQLSGGQQQRVALARAMAIAPEALLLDEPLSALDSYLRNQIEKLLTEVFSTYEGVTLFVTHKLEEAYRTCDNILVFSEGKVIASGSKEDIFQHPPTFRVAQLTECKNFSPVEIIDNQKIKALDWGCNLQVIEPLTKPIKYVGIRAHHLIFCKQPNLQNTFPCWLVTMSETQHRVTLYLHLYNPSTNRGDYHLQAEVFKEKWNDLKNQPLPWYVHLQPLRLILMES